MAGRGYPLRPGRWGVVLTYLNGSYVPSSQALKRKAADTRITLYWNPAVKLDENGEATVSFYTSDSDSNYRIEVEGRSAARQYHYAEKIIELISVGDSGHKSGVLSQIYE